MRPYQPPDKKSPPIETLKGIMERLCATDLTAAEARDLRLHLIRLMETIECENRRETGDRKAARESQRYQVV